MSKGAILYLTDSFFPTGTAYASRVLNLCSAFTTLDYDVFVLADSTKDCKKQTINGIKYWTVSKKSKKLYETKLHIEQLIEKYGQKIFVVFGAHDTFRFLRLRKYIERKKLKVILECCEWYDVASYKLGYFDYRYLRFQYCIYRGFLKAERIIAISTFLEKHFVRGHENSGIIRIPTILDTKKIAYSQYTSNKKLRIVFAGMIGNNGKENFNSFLTAVASFGSPNPFEICIYGGTESQLRKSLSKDEALSFDQIKDFVHCFGIIPQSEVNQVYMSADFSIIFRPNRRSSHAGFPTKLAESMAAGTPVIANNTGDIGLYLKDGYNGYICENTVDDIKKCLKEILGLGKKQKNEMREHSRLTAETYFDYHEYVEAMHDLLGE